MREDDAVIRCMKEGVACAFGLEGCGWSRAEERGEKRAKRFMAIDVHRMRYSRMNRCFFFFFFLLPPSCGHASILSSLSFPAGSFLGPRSYLRRMDHPFSLGFYISHSNYNQGENAFVESILTFLPCSYITLRM